MNCRINNRGRISSLVCALCLLMGFPHASGMPGPSRQTIERIVSQHVLIRMPPEREWLGRETIMELERCYLFIHKTTRGSLPARVSVKISWDEQESNIRPEEAAITIGMGNPASVADSRGYLLHSAAREMAHLALLEVSKGGAERVENQFLLEGMKEILASEFERSSRALNAAWVRCHFMDKIDTLSLAALASWDRFSGGRRDQRAASPGITFLLMCREVGGRDSLRKLFEGMPRRSLPDNLAAAFKSAAAVLEGEWLKRVRSYRTGEDLTVTSDEDAPRLERTELDPDAGVPGQELRIRAFIRDRSGDLRADTIFFEERDSGSVQGVQAATEAGARYVRFTVPIPRDRKPGNYDYRLVAVDETGNVRIWPGAYAVVSK